MSILSLWPITIFYRSFVEKKATILTLENKQHLADIVAAALVKTPDDAVLHRSQYHRTEIAQAQPPPEKRICKQDGTNKAFVNQSRLHTNTSTTFAT